ncbi:hypothetical protein HR12_38060 [Microbacterium sp. SUBG005]|nr:hypothetical protein HR12_38060 [Microbacterium sp. SUBG005]
MRLGLLLDLEAQVQAFAREDLDAAEVDVGADGVGLRLVEGPALSRSIGALVRGGVSSVPGSSGAVPSGVGVV